METNNSQEYNSQNQLSQSEAINIFGFLIWDHDTFLG